MPSLVSINVGRPEKIGSRSAPSGINKRPVAEARIERLGLAGDAVLDRKHHGGVDQAVYLYLQSDYDWWQAELGRQLPPGSFGDNLTIAGIDGASLCVGDRLAIGDVLLELTSHRTPCATFAASMGDPQWVKRFHAARRPGAYARVLAEGTVRAGAAVDYRPYAGTPVRIADLMGLDGRRTIDADTLRHALTAPVHHKMRADFEARLDSLA